MSLAVLTSRALVGLQAPKCASRCTSPTGCRPSRWWACPMWKCAKPATGCAPPCRPPVRISPAAHHRQPRPRRSTQGRRLLRPAHRPRHPRRLRADSRRPAGTATSSPGSCPSPASCARCAARWPWPGRPPSSGRMPDPARGQRPRGRAGAPRHVLPATSLLAVAPTCAGTPSSRPTPACPSVRPGYPRSLRRERPEPGPPRARSGGQRAAFPAASTARRAPASPCSPSACRACSRRWTTTKPLKAPPCSRSRAASAPNAGGTRPMPCAAPLCLGCRPGGRRQHARAPAKSAWPTTACCSSMNCRSSTGASSKPCANPWRAATSPSPAPHAGPNSPPAFQLIAAMNPCPCGYHGHPDGRCRCTPDQIARYRGKLSGPAARSHRPAPRSARRCRHPTCSRPSTGEPTAAGARAGRAEPGPDPARPPGQTQRPLAGARSRRGANPTKTVQTVTNGHRSPGLSARGYHRILKVARTIADMSGAEVLSAPPMWPKPSRAAAASPNSSSNPKQEFLKWHPPRLPARPAPRTGSCGSSVSSSCSSPCWPATPGWCSAGAIPPASAPATCRSFPRRAGCARPGKAKWPSSPFPAACPRSSSSPCVTTRLPPRSTAVMGKRVSIAYEQHVGIPSTCFGETGYYVGKIHVVE
jgi:hypothetical protein